MSEVRRGHYITRGVTRAWERANDRHLYYFDVTTETIECAPSSKLFALEGLHTTDTERKLTQRVEDSVGK